MPKKRSPPAETERSPPAETERSPPAETERSPPAETERSPPAETERSPPAETERSPPAETERSTPVETELSPVAESEPSPPAAWVAFAGFAALTFVHLVLFYRADADGTRLAALPILFVPDQWLAMWCGGKLADFSLLDRLPILVATVAILLGAGLAGSLLLEVSRIARMLNGLERTVFSLAVGLNLLSLYALAVGLAGRLHDRWLFVMPLVVLAIAKVAWLVVARRRGMLARAGETPAPQESPAGDLRVAWWLLAAAPFTVLMVLGAMLPPAAYDVREYHLQVPKEWFQQGRIDFLPHNIYGNMPLGSELTALWGMALIGGDDGWWWGALVGKTVMASYSLVTAAGLVAFGRRVHSLAAGVAAAVAFLSTPWVSNVAVVGYNEGPVALYCLTAFYALWLAWHSETLADRARLTALAGFLAGSAVACKYPPALFLVVPLAAWVALGPLAAQFFQRLTKREPVAAPHSVQPRFSIPHAILATGLFAALATAGCGLWLAKNAALSGNPTYPLLYGLFDGETRTPEKDSQWTRVHSPQPDASGRRFTLSGLIHEIRYVLWGTKWAGLALLPLAVAAWFAREQRGLLVLIAAWLLFVFAVWWLLTHRLDRFLAPVLPLVALAAGIGAAALPQRSWRITTFAFLSLAALVQLPLLVLPTMADNRYFAPLAALRRDDPDLGPLSEMRVNAAHKWLNEQAPAGSRVLLVGDAEPFDLKIPATYNTCFDDCQFTRLLQGRTRAERLAALRKEGLTHVFISWAHLNRYRSPGNYGYPSDFITPGNFARATAARTLPLRRIEIGMDPKLGELFEVTD